MELWVSVLIGLVIGIVIAAGIVFWAWRTLLIPQQQRLDALRQKVDEEKSKADKMQREAEAKLREAETKLRDANLLVREDSNAKGKGSSKSIGRGGRNF